MSWLDEIGERWAKGAKGPWMWDVNTATHAAHLTTTHSGRIYVMGFRRWGTQSAQPLFQDYERGIVEPLSKWAIPRQAHHPDFDMDVDHPDAQKIAHAPSDIARLLAVARAAEVYLVAKSKAEDLTIVDYNENYQNQVAYIEAETALRQALQEVQ